MKKITILLFAVFAIIATANAGVPSFNWAHTVDGATSAGDNIIGTAKAADGDYLIATTFGTTKTDLGVNFDGATLQDKNGNAIEGSPYTGTSNNGNLLLQKVATDGAVKWFAYTRKGDVEQSCSKIVATTDGGAVAVLKVRAWVKEAGYDNLLEVVDAAGAVTTVKDMGTQAGEYRYLVVKINADGNLEWTRLIAGLAKETSKSITKNNAYVNGVDVDENDNIYIAGNFRTELYFKKADGNTETLVAKNNANWDGDSQKVIGDLFLVKLDKDGYFVNKLVADGTAACAFFDNVVYNDGKLYLNGRVQGDGSAMTLGGKTVNASSTLQTEIIASVNTSDFSVNYVNALTSVANKSGKFVIQNKNVQYVDGKVYFTGLLNGGLANGSAEAFLNTNNTILKAYLLQVEPSTGEVVNSLVEAGTGISGYFGVYVGSNNIYAFGYNMGKGAVLATINKSSFAAGDEYVICKFGMVAACANPIIDGSNFIMMNRGKSASTYYGTDTSFSGLKNWAVTYYSYKMDDNVGVNGINADNAAKNYDVYTTSGIFVKGATSMEEAKAGLDKGVYVIGGEKVAVQ